MKFFFMYVLTFLFFLVLRRNMIKVLKIIIIQKNVYLYIIIHFVFNTDVDNVDDDDDDNPCMRRRRICDNL